MNQQLSFSLRPRGDSLPVTPFPLAPRKTIRARRAQLRQIDLPASGLFIAARLLEDQALLDQVRRRARAQACAGGRMSKRAMLAYFAHANGRRVARVVAALSERIAAQEALLCG